MKQHTLKRLMYYVQKEKKQTIIALIGAFLYVITTLSIPILTGQALNFIIGKNDVSFKQVFNIVVVILIATVISSIMQWFMQVSTRKISATISQKMRDQAFDKINTVPLSIIDTHKQGDIVSRLINDADNVAEGLLQSLTQLFPSIITIIGTIVIMLRLNVFIALGVIFITPLSILFAKMVTKRTGSMFREQMTQQGNLFGFTSEMIENESLIQDFNYEESSEAVFSDINKKWYQANFTATFYSSIINPGTRFINAIIYALVGVLGALAAINGTITVGGVSIFLSYANQYSKPFNDITSVITLIQNMVASAERLFEVIDWKSEKPDTINAIEKASCHGDVELKNVDFAYVQDKQILNDVSIMAKSGQHIAFVGPTGSGKTTLINLLMRFYEVNNGSIQVDSTPIDDYKRNTLRSFYGMVLQETWLKQASVRDNIAYGKPDATKEEVIQAAKAAYAHSFIMRLPQGYDTIITNFGDDFSAGQKQLLCIARIMLCKPDMLILDEATSSIDTRTEVLIQKAINKLMDGHTSFLVAHRLSTIQNADIIAVMNNGHIVEKGTHENLLIKKGFYYNLYNSQFMTNM